MRDPDAGVMPERDIDAAFAHASSVTRNIANSRAAGVRASPFDDRTGLVSRMRLRYSGGV